MLAWTPLLKDIKEYSPQLKIHLDQSHNDLKARKLHRTASVDWTNKMKNLIVEDGRMVCVLYMTISLRLQL